MFQRLRRSRAAVALAALAAFAAFGYFSNAMTTSACERATAQWVNEQLARHPTNWPDRRAWSDPARYRLPWIVAIEYEWAASGTGGEWGTRYYLALFGIPIPITTHVRGQS